MAASRAFGWVDRTLSPERRAASRDELRRARLLAGVLLVLISTGAVEMVMVPLFGSTSVVVLVGWLALASFTTSLLLLRFTRGSLQLPSLLLCGTLFGLFFFFSICQGGSFVVRNPTQVAALLLIAYLLGPRTAFVLGGVLVAEVLLVARLQELGLSLPIALQATAPRPIATALFDSFGIVIICALGYLYESSRVQAQRALQQSEANLSAVIENTDASICYLDPQGRVVAANSTLKERVLEWSGRALEMGHELFELSTPEEKQRWRERFSRALAGERLLGQEKYGDRVWFDYSLAPIPDGKGGAAGLTLYGMDVTQRVQNEAELASLHRQLVDASRQAGMAEVANGILHNVGNTLNSVNVSAHLIATHLGASKMQGLSRLAELLRAHSNDLAGFFSSDGKGRHLPEYIERLAETLGQERDSLRKETADLLHSIDHVSAIISVQQSQGRNGGVIETVSVPELLDDALRLHGDSLSRAGIVVERSYCQLAPVSLDRHKLLQIVVNLISNARDSLIDSPDKRLAVHVAATAGWLHIEVRDSGGGMTGEVRARLFQQGFTTKKAGHGFGLHMSALMAAEMGGCLGGASDGPGQGAIFRLDLPMVAVAIAV